MPAKTTPSSKSTSRKAASGKATPGRKPAKVVEIKKHQVYESKTQDTEDGARRRVKVTDVVGEVVHYEPQNYTRKRSGKGRPVSESTFRRDYTLIPRKDL